LGTVRGLHEVWRWQPTDVLLHALPLVHIHGLVVAQYGALFAGASSIWLDRFEPDLALRTLREEAITVFMGVPTFYQRLMRHPEPWPELPALRLLTSGSAGLPADLHRAFRHKTGRSIVERYGLTEAGILTSNPPDCPQPGSVGLPLPGVRIRIVDRDGAGRSAGEIGEVEAQGPGLFHGYLHQPEATAAAFRDGWFRTGDLGQLDEGGRLTLSGRASELILSGGYNVYPAEIDAVANACPGVTEAASFPIPDEDLGEVVGLAWVSTAGLTSAELLAFLRANLAPYKVPRVFRQVEGLPRNALGKVLRRELSESHR
jgi:malonyl-CoA/methylmalonyl-CoA synthetase